MLLWKVQAQAGGIWKYDGILWSQLLAMLEASMQMVRFRSLFIVSSLVECFKTIVRQILYSLPVQVDLIQMTKSWQYAAIHTHECDILLPYEFTACSFSSELNILYITGESGLKTKQNILKVYRYEYSHIQPLSNSLESKRRAQSKVEATLDIFLLVRHPARISQHGLIKLLGSLSSFLTL